MKLSKKGWEGVVTGMRLPLMLRLLYGASLLLGKIIALGYLRYDLSTNIVMGNGKDFRYLQKGKKVAR